MEIAMEEGYVSVEDAVKLLRKEGVHNETKQLGQWIKTNLLKKGIVLGIEPPSNKVGWKVDEASLNNYIASMKESPEYLKSRINELFLENKELKERNESVRSWWIEEGNKVKKLELEIVGLKQQVFDVEALKQRHKEDVEELLALLPKSKRDKYLKDKGLVVEQEQAEPVAEEQQEKKTGKRKAKDRPEQTEEQPQTVGQG